MESLKTAFQGMRVLSSGRGFFPCLFSSRIGLPPQSSGTAGYSQDGAEAGAGLAEALAREPAPRPLAPREASRASGTELLAPSFWRRASGPEPLWQLAGTVHGSQTQVLRQNRRLAHQDCTGEQGAGHGGNLSCTKAGRRRNGQARPEMAPTFRKPPASPLGHAASLLSRWG